MSEPAKRGRVDPLKPLSAVEQVFHDLFDSFSRTTLSLVWRAQRADVQPLPAGPVIVAPNHRSFLDPPVVGALIGEPMRFLMIEKYYDLPLLRHFFRLERCLVVDDDLDNRRVLREAKRVLEAGHKLCLFPEGGISPDGSLQRGRPGMAWLSRRTGVPIAPVYIGGTREALPRGSWLPRPGRICMATGDLVHPDDFAPGRAGDLALTEAVMTSIGELGRRHGAPDPWLVERD